MLAPKNEFLDGSRIKYVTITHSLAYTAQEIAASAHVAGKELAKTVIVKIDDKMAMAVLPASYKVSFDLLKKAAGASKVELANEQEFRDMFPELEVGAMPPFWKSLWDGSFRGRKFVPRRRDCV
jgi:Ala-tRNA(Pro) deacylase